MTNFQRIDSNYPIEKILPFCESAIGDDRPGAQNMHPIDWEDNKGSFLYLLYKEKRYDGFGNGYIIATKDNRIVCGMGYSISDVDTKMIHINSRTYTIPDVRVPRVHGLIHDYVVDISREAGFHGSFSSLNEYNIKFVDGYIKINDPKTFKTYFFQDGKHYAKTGVRIHPMKKAGPVIIKGTKQWIMYQVWNEVHRESFLRTLDSIRWDETE